MICLPLHTRVSRLAVLLCVAGLTLAQPSGWAGSPAEDFTELSIEELDALSVSAASKRAQPLFQTPAAVSVLLPVDIQRTGHASIAEALRLVPGVHVASQMPGRWNVGVRGFNGLTSTKLLVLVDGRSVYAPFYGSVEWVNADVHLDDLARVEVVRGPGATLWGANAVNGIINVISKDARDTQGTLVALRAGTGEEAEAHVRYGAKVGQRTWYRVFVTASDTNAALGALRDDPLGDRQLVRFGARTDSHLSERLQLTWQLEYLNTRRGSESSGGESHLGSVLGRLVGREVAGGDLQVQLYFDHDHARTTARQTGAVDVLPVGLNSDTTNVDLDLTHTFRGGSRHAVTWGGGARLTVSDVKPSPGLSVSRARRDQWLFNGFIQDEISFWDDHLRLTIGTKLEHHEHIGWQPQPNVRLTWLPRPDHTVWASVAHAVRAPSRAEREVRIALTPRRVPGVPFPVAVELTGDPDFSEERNTAYEIGWRWRPTPRFQTDVTAYAFDYDKLRTAPTWTTLEFTPAPVIVQHYTAANEGDMWSYGAEGSWQWRVHDRWELGGGVAYGRMQAGDLASGPFLSTDYALPTWIGHLRSWWELPRNFEMSVAAYGTSRNPLAGYASRVRLDARLGWRPRPDLSLALGVRDATDPGHMESNTGPLLPRTEQRRSVFLRLQWRY
jgi:iron complex outermembrane recepter protein